MQVLVLYANKKSKYKIMIFFVNFVLECKELEIIKTENDILFMLDNLLEKRDNEWWDKFYSDKEKPVPFFLKYS